MSKRFLLLWSVGWLLALLLLAYLGPIIPGAACDGAC
jgi:hypothetical protein